MRDVQPNIVEIDEQIATARENIRELIEEASAYSGAADDDLVAQRIADQEALLELLTRHRDELSRVHTGEMR